MGIVIRAQLSSSRSSAAGQELTYEHVACLQQRDGLLQVLLRMIQSLHFFESEKGVRLSCGRRFRPDDAASDLPRVMRRTLFSDADAASLSERIRDSRDATDAFADSTCLCVASALSEGGRWGEEREREREMPAVRDFDFRSRTSPTD